MILQSGVALTDLQLVDARRVGVAHPDRIRLLRVEQIQTTGLTLRYGIFIRGDCWGERRLTVHEFVHTMQYERLGGVEGFLRPYLLECINPPGYPFGPMEQEAKRVQRRVPDDRCSLPKDA